MPHLHHLNVKEKTAISVSRSSLRDGGLLRINFDGTGLFIRG